MKRMDRVEKTMKGEKEETKIEKRKNESKRNGSIDTKPRGGHERERQPIGTVARGQGGMPGRDVDVKEREDRRRSRGN